MPLAPTIPPPPALHSTLAAEIASHLATGGRTATLHSPASSGTAAIAREVVTQVGLPLLSVQLSGCRSPADILLAVGWACRAVPPGDEAAVLGALRRRDRTLVLLENADVNGIQESWRRMRAAAPHARWLLTGVRAPIPQAPDAANRDAQSFVLTTPHTEGAEHTDADITPPTHLDALEPLLRIATGAPIPDGISWREALQLRHAGELISDPDDACRCSAAAAHLLLTWGQGTEAQELLSRAARRNVRASATHRSLLLWAEGDIRLASGDLESAQRLWEAAGALLRTTRDDPLQASLLCHRAERLASRGAKRAASRAYREARAIYRRMGDAAGVASTLRGAADLAVAAGEALSAEVLYDQAEATRTGATEEANRKVGQASLALARGELTAARRLLDTARRDAPPLLRANLLRRRADLALRQGRHARASQLARRAADQYGDLGEASAMAAATRLLGDVAAARGRLAEAERRYRRATVLQIRCADVHGLRRTLNHRVALAQTVGDMALAASLDRLRGRLEPPERTETTVA